MRGISHPPRWQGYDKTNPNKGQGETCCHRSDVGSDFPTGRSNRLSQAVCGEDDARNHQDQTSWCPKNKMADEAEDIGEIPEVPDSQKEHPEEPREKNQGTQHNDQFSEAELPRDTSFVGGSHQSKSYRGDDNEGETSQTHRSSVFTAGVCSYPKDRDDYDEIDSHRQEDQRQSDGNLSDSLHPQAYPSIHRTVWGYIALSRGNHE